MGNWHISVEGIGCHHNKDYPKDSNKMAAEFVKALKAAGHTVVYSSFTYGGAERIDEVSDKKETDDTA